MERREPSRRDFLRRTAVAGGVLWAAPVIDSIISPAYAAGSVASACTCTGNNGTNQLLKKSYTVTAVGTAIFSVTSCTTSATSLPSNCTIACYTTAHSDCDETTFNVAMGTGQVTLTYPASTTGCSIVGGAYSATGLSTCVAGTPVANGMRFSGINGGGHLFIVYCCTDDEIEP